MPQSRITSFVKISLTLAAVCAALFAHSTVARANMAAPQPGSRPGDAPREPSGELKSMHIERETLVIDLRPLKDRRPAIVEATYTVRNDGEQRDLELVFVADAMRPGVPWVWNGHDWAQDPKRAQAEGGVWLDGQTVAALADSNTEGLPQKWVAPFQTPGLFPGQSPLPYKTLGEGTLTFRVTLATGEHNIRVRYEARPGAYCDTRSHAIYWQLGYVLAPAREWASFGKLDAKVLLPRGWRAEASQEMRREGDALVAMWDKIPADTLAVTAQTNERTFSDEGVFWVVLIVQGCICTVLAAFAGWLIGRWLGRRGRNFAWSLLVAPALAVLFVYLSYLFADVLAAPSAPEQAAFNAVGGYGGIITFFLVIVITGWLFIITLIAAFIARRRALPA
jgi:hypothetical protein